MKEYSKVVFALLGLLVIPILCEKDEELAETITEETDINIDTETQRQLEVPDSSLLLLDRLNGRGVPALQYHARARQNNSNSTSTEDEDPGGCICDNGICKCCTGAVLDLFNQKACMRITYHPGDFAFDVAMSMNDRILYENSLSGKNPKPICISPPRIRNLKVCAKFHDVFFPGRNIHFCMAMVGQWGTTELFNMSFNCLRMGANGIKRVRPEDAGGLVLPSPGGGVDAVVDSGDDIEDYDENVVKSLLDIFDR